MIEDTLVDLSPVSFFQLRLDCPYGKTPRPLPDTSALCNEVPFATVSMSWTEEGLYFNVASKRKFRDTFYPNIQKGDSFEVFIDTRDMKSASFNTRFCHHFFCLPKACDGVQAKEITKFRTEDTHELCDEKKLIVKSTIQAKGYSMDFFIPKECLHSFDPSQFDRLGFSYRVNSLQGEPQHFSISSADFSIEQQPSLWSSVRLVK